MSAQEIPLLSPAMEKAAVDALVQFLDDMSPATARSVVNIVYSAARHSRDGDVTLPVPRRKGYGMTYSPAPPAFEAIQPGRLWSLWDMLRIHAQLYISLGAKIREAEVFFLLKERGISGKRIDEWQSNSGGELGGSDLPSTIKIMRLTCEEMGLPVSVDLLTRSEASPPNSRGELMMLVRAIYSEMRARLFLLVPAHVAGYYENDAALSEKAAEAFPSAYNELREAGNCLAAGLYTACVFHSMRAAEIGLRALGHAHEIKIKGDKPLHLAEWREILDGLSNAVRDIENEPNSAPEKETRSHFLSEAAAQFRFFKNGWRVRVAHARATYTEPQAIEALDHVRSFFETMAARLKEPPA